MARAGGEDHRVGGIDRAAIALGGEGALRELEVGDDVHDDLAAHGAGVLFHVDHQLGPLDLGLARPVLDLGRGGQLPARFHPLHEDRLQHRAAGIDAGGIAGGAGSDDENLGVAGLGHGSFPLESEPDIAALRRGLKAVGTKHIADMKCVMWRNDIAPC